MNKEKLIIKEQIVNAAFEILREGGFSSVTTRKISLQAGCSTQMIYKWYANMEELKRDVIEKAILHLQSIIYSFHKIGNPFSDNIMGYVYTAHVEPVLFKFVFIDNSTSVKLTDIIKNKRVTSNIRKSLRSEPCKKMQRTILDNWMYAHGLATLISSGIIPYEEEKIKRMLLDF